MRIVLILICIQWLIFSNEISASNQDSLLVVKGLEEATKQPHKVGTIILEGYNDFPRGLTGLPNLTTIILHNSTITTIPDNFP